MNQMKASFVQYMIGSHCRWAEQGKNVPLLPEIASCKIFSPSQYMLIEQMRAEEGVGEYFPRFS
jgi:hypothetical protein